ncbi:MAG: Uma2 family endonuclease [Planctomycetota bacterium]
MEQLAPAPSNRMTVEEYLAFEEVAAQRHEYHDGEVLAMAGTTEEHSGVSFNLNAALHTGLRGKPCRGHGSDLKVWVGESNRFLYPDALVICGETQYAPQDKNHTLITNPTLVVEILSESTAEFDRTEKFSFYRMLPSLREYVLVAQNRAAIDTFFRDDDGTWRFDASLGLDAVARFRSIDVQVKLADVYDGIPLPDPATLEPKPDDA